MVGCDYNTYIVRSGCVFFFEKLLRGGEIEMAICEGGGGGHTCVHVYMLVNVRNT